MRRNTSHGAATTPASSARSLIAIALLYNIARLALAAALTGLILLVAYLIDVDVPFFVTVVLAVILSSPVSMIALKPPTNSYQLPGRSNGLPPSNQEGTRQTGRDMSWHQASKHDQPGPTVLPNMQCGLPDR